MEIEQKIVALGLSLPSLTPPAHNFVRAVRTGNLVFLSGSLARDERGVIQGKIGYDLTVEQAYEAAKLATLRLLSALKTELGDLDRVKRIVKLSCMVNAAPGFDEPGKVANGASDLLTALYGDSARHARSAFGVSALEFGACFEVEMVVEVN